jgi:photosynthetic reaction center cytochrome c subunit
MNRLSKIVPFVAGVAVLTVLAGCERPPVTTVQNGYRGTGMELVYNPRTLAKTYAENQVPEVIPAADPSGPRASEVYENVQVLKDLSVGEFTRVMLAMTAWVAPPDQSCAYCHVNGEPLSADTLYTKKVARKMLEMTRHVNTQWKTHVKETGVTCYTCHHGQPVPQYKWFTDPGPGHQTGFIATRAGQNVPADSVARSTLPYDPFTPFLLKDYPIRVQGAAALPSGNRHSIKETEWTYSLMIHMSKSLGVNCEYCHNSRAWSNWEESSPQRATAWYGIRMARDLNNAYLEPLTGTFPANRLGPTGDVAKVNCSTCHRGAFKPLFGVSMAKDYPELQGARPMPAPAPADGTGETPPADGAAAPAAATAAAPAAAPAKAM